MRVELHLSLARYIATLLLAFSVLWVMAPSKHVFAQQTCKVQVNFKVTDIEGRQLSSLANANTQFRLSATYTPKPVGAECYGATFKHRFRAMFADGSYTFIGAEESVSFQLTENARREDLLPKEVSLGWQTNGLNDFNTKKPVQNNGVIKLEAYLATSGGVTVTKSSPITLAVQSESQVPEGQKPPGNLAQTEAQVSNQQSQSGQSQSVNISGGLTNPVKHDNIGELISGVIKFLLGLIGALSVLFIVIGGVRMIGSAGKETQVAAGKKTLTWAVVGLLVALLGYTFISLITRSI